MQKPFTSVWNFGDAQKQHKRELCNHTECENCLKLEESCEISDGDSESVLRNGNVERTPGEVSDEDGGTNEQSAEVHVSSVVNGDACVGTATASSFSALHSSRALSDDANIGADAVQTDRWIYVENSAVAEPQKNEAFCSSLRQGPVSSALVNTGAVECTSSVHDGNSNCLNDVEQLSDTDTRHVHQSQVLCKGSDYLPAKSGQDVTPLKANDDVAMLDNEATEVKNTDVLNEVSEAVFREEVAVVADCGEAAVADGTMCLARRDIPAHAILDSGDNCFLANANSRLLNSGGKVEDFSGGKCGQDLEVGEVPDGVSAGFAYSDEVPDVSTDFVAPRIVKSAPAKLVIRCEDVECRADLDSTKPVDARNGVVPDRQSVEKQRSEIANNIEQLEAWLRSADADVRSTTATDDAAVALSLVEQYADELQKNRLQLDQLSAQVGQIEKFDRDVCCDERYRLVSVHTQLHGLSAAVSSIASNTVCISWRLLRSCILQ